MISTLIRKLKNIITPEHRGSKRWITSGLQCSITVGKSMKVKSISVNDISQGGCSIISHTPHYYIDDKVTIFFQMRANAEIIRTGKIVSQVIYYPAGTDNLKDAFYRFSVSFEQILKNDEVEKIRSGIK